MRWPVATLALFLFSCSEPGTRPLHSDVRAPDDVDVGMLWLGWPERLELELANGSSFAIRIRLGGGDEKIRVPPQELELAAGVDSKFPILVEPLAPGRFKDLQLEVTGEGVSHRVMLRGEVLEPPECASASACSQSRFSPDTGECEVEPVNEGVPCEEPCLVGRCSGGMCKGNERACPDDGDPCTVPVCSAQTGCGAVPLECIPKAPCFTARCEPGVGCVEEQVPDGTSCGEPHCDQNYVCINGECEQRTPPHGLVVTPCLKASSIHMPAYEGVSCAVTPDSYGVCWGSVLHAFSSNKPGFPFPQWTSPWVARTDRPIRKWLGRGSPMCAQTHDGRVYCMSDGSNSNFWNTDEVGFFEIERFRDAVDVMRFANVMCVLNQEGAVHCWGRDPPGYTAPECCGYPILPDHLPGPTFDGENIVPVGARAVQLAGGPVPEWPCVLLDNGQVLCRDVYERRIKGGCTSMLPLGSFALVPGWPPLAGFSSANDHACGVSLDGGVMCAGGNGVHQLGRPGYEASPDPQEYVVCQAPAPAWTPSDATKVVTGDWQSCALRRNETVWCWGAGPFIGNDGEGFHSPFSGFDKVPELRFIRDIALSGGGRTYHREEGPKGVEVFYLDSVLCALDVHGRVKCGGQGELCANGEFIEGDPRWRNWHSRPAAVVLPPEEITIELRERPDGQP